MNGEPQHEIIRLTYATMFPADIPYGEAMGIAAAVEYVGDMMEDGEFFRDTLFVKGVNNAYFYND